MNRGTYRNQLEAKDLILTANATKILQVSDYPMNLNVGKVVNGFQTPVCVDVVVLSHVVFDEVNLHINHNSA